MAFRLERSGTFHVLLFERLAIRGFVKGEWRQIFLRPGPGGFMLNAFSDIFASPRALGSHLVAKMWQDSAKMAQDAPT